MQDLTLFFLEINGQLVQVEFKNYLSTTWKNNLRKAIHFKSIASSGQLFSDIVAFSQNGNKGKQYIFTPDVGATADEILDHIGNLIDENKDNFRSALDVSKSQWNSFRNELFYAMAGNGGTQDPFVKVATFENLID